MNTRTLRKKLRSLGHALIPPRWRLPLRFWWTKRNGDLEPEMFYLSSLTDRASVAVDVGANFGFYSYSLCRYFQRVEAFEANPGVVVDLVSYRAPNIHVHRMGLSSTAGRGRLFVPVSSVGAEYSGWGSLERAGLPATPSVREIELELATLDSFRFQNVGLIKIDVEGHEQDVLEGARQTIERWRPTVLVEVKPRSRKFVAQYFQQFNYRLHYFEGAELKLLSAEIPLESWPQENVFAMPVGTKPASVP